MENRGKKGKVFFNIVSILYVICLLRIVLFKRVTLIHLIKYGINPAKRALYLTPFVGISNIFKGLYNFFGVFQNYIGNIVLFVPLGLIVNYYKKEISYKRCFFYGALVSISFEIIQYIFAIGTSDINDVITNSIGALLGCFLYKKILQKSKNEDIKRNKISIVILLIILVSIIYIICIISYEETHVKTYAYNKQVVSYLKDFRSEKGTYVNFKDNVITIKNKVYNEEYTYKVCSNARYYCIEHKKVYGDFANNVVANYFNYYEVSKDYFLKSKCLKKGSKIKIYLNNNNKVKAILYMVEKN